MSDNEIVEHEQSSDDFPSLDRKTTHDDIQHNKRIEHSNRNRNSQLCIKSIIIFVVFAIAALPIAMTLTSSHTGDTQPINDINNTNQSDDHLAIDKIQQGNYHALHMIWDRMRKINRMITSENAGKHDSHQINQKWSREVLHLAEKFLEEMEFFQEIQYYSLTQERNLLEETLRKQENKTHLEL